MKTLALQMTLADYLAWEEQQPGRNEFHRGAVLAVPDPVRGHGTVVANLVCEIGTRLKGSPCRAMSTSAQLQVGDDTMLYPDLFVTCDRGDLRTEMIFRAPLLAIEVLSPTTQAYDKGRKFALYRQLPSLREYVLIDPDTRDVQAFRRNAADEWVLHDMTDTEALVLPCIDARVPLAEVFDGVDAA
jgi:Uma2 family endonuclease